MALVLGIHVGHHSACAVVKDGALVAAAQLERFTRQKHHPVLSLSNEIDFAPVLREAGATIDDVDRIVTSFQSIAPGGFGLDRALIEPDFSRFDPWADRHHVISHHLAHSHCAFDASGFDDAAVLICDYAGSGTLDGGDYALPFAEWFRSLTSHQTAPKPRVECLSIYGATRTAPHQLKYREYNVSHQGRPSHMYSVASLYENMTRYVMGSANAHGQMMALAAYGRDLVGGADDPGPLVAISADDEIAFRNDWQHAVPRKPTFEQQCLLAWRCQEATEAALLAHARRAHRLTGSKNIAVAGGVFLNILANTRIAAEGPFTHFSVPSAPHDAGIAVGCAFWGARALGDRGQQVRTDRLGPTYSDAEIDAALDAQAAVIERRAYTDDEIVDALVGNRIIARWNGRSELGPRALGGRSLLASPLDVALRDRMNVIKSRQAWRPVAPVIPQDALERFFTGPSHSWWMTMSHEIPAAHREKLGALAHPDHSTRSQTLLEEQDPELHRWLHAFGARTGYPILVNTSFNRGDEPIVETAAHAIDMFLARPDIDLLLVGRWLVTRRPRPVRTDSDRYRLADAVVLATTFRDGARVHHLTNGRRSWRITRAVFEALDLLGQGDAAPVLARVPEADRPQIQELIEHGVLQS